MVQKCNCMIVYFATFTAHMQVPRRPLHGLVFYIFTQASTQFLPLEIQCQENNTYTQNHRTTDENIKTSFLPSLKIMVGHHSR